MIPPGRPPVTRRRPMERPGAKSQAARATIRSSAHAVGRPLTSSGTLRTCWQVGVNAFIHYGTHVGDGGVIEAHSFLMKGEEVPPGARRHGNPATHHHDDRDMAGPAAMVHALG
jgi:hypothetical protein